MIFIQMRHDYQSVTPDVEKIVDFKEITEQMIEDGEHEDILREKSNELGTGCDPLPYFITIKEAQSLCDALTKKIEEAALAAKGDKNDDYR